MPKLKKGTGQRAYRPKTRAGCQTSRRVKCDETRPACHRCTSIRRVCDGYSNVRPPTGSDIIAVIAAIVAGPSFNLHASPQSGRSFSFFVQHTRPQLAGFFGSDFWERLVLQAAYHESTVRHAIVAIGSLHELVEHQTTVTDANNAFALEQYNFAIRELLVPLSRNGERGVDVCLISCILFTCFENMQGRHASAGAHIRSGEKLLRETLYDQQNRVLRHHVLGIKSAVNFYAPPEVLARIFGGLGSQVTMVVGDAKFNLNDRSLFETMYRKMPATLSFTSIEEAKDIYEYGCSLFTSGRVVAVSGSGQFGLLDIEEARKLQFEMMTSKFALALQAFVESKSLTFTAKEDVAIAVLQLHVLSAYCFHIQQVPPVHRSGGEESFMAQIKKMLAFAEKIVSFMLSNNSNNHFQEQTTSYCLDMGIIIPLYDIATRCPDAVIRRKAIALLRSISRQEGLWNSLLVARAAERIMEIEIEIEEREVAGRMQTFSTGNSPGALSAQPPTLQLDSRGGRLLYARLGGVGGVGGVETQINVVEEVFIW